MEDLLEIPPFLDRRPNGRCRAFWMAHKNCPGNRNPHDYANERWRRYLPKALEKDKEEGRCPPCRSLGPESKKQVAPVRVRRRVRPPAEV